MKLLFVDIDGVLSPGSHNKDRRYSNQYSYSAEWYAEVLDPACMKWLNLITKKTQAKVVISSAWREGKTIKFLQEIFDTAGFKGKIIGKTRSGRLKRGEQIAEWIRDSVEMYGFEPTESFCILDDKNDMLPLNYFLVQTNFDSGLTEKEAKRAIRMLNRITTPDGSSYTGRILIP